MAAKAPGKCCGTGTLHTGTPRGRMQTFGGVETYITGHSSTKVLLYLTDILGHVLPNNQLLADDFAAAGYKVIMPDLFSGDAWPLNPPEGADLNAWLAGHGLEQTEPIITAVMADIESKLKPKSLAAAGYCFGGKYVTRLLAAGGAVQSGFMAHPSFVTMEEVSAVSKPLAIAAAETDTIFPPELRHQTEAKLTEIKAQYQINLFSGVAHGFAVRGNMSVPVEKYAKDQAFKQAVDWYAFTLSK
ncbi:Alpha/Beta hydrolase protein [Geopyxis carbonaria]|nr:Alpha/Beta hydrolase protein [Geopyxis carbonaria]